MIDVVVLWKHPTEPDNFGYSVPILLNEDTEIYEGFASEQEALERGLQHLADIEGCSVDEYKRLMEEND